MKQLAALFLTILALAIPARSQDMCRQTFAGSSLSALGWQTSQITLQVYTDALALCGNSSQCVSPCGYGSKWGLPAYDTPTIAIVSGHLQINLPISGWTPPRPLMIPPGAVWQAEVGFQDPTYGWLSFGFSETAVSTASVNGSGDSLGAGWPSAYFNEPWLSVKVRFKNGSYTGPWSNLVTQ